MNRLWLKLLGAFGVVILIGVLVTVLVARQAAAAQLSHFMVGNQMVRPAVLQQAAREYYAEQGSWSGIDRRLPPLVRAASDGGMMAGMMGGMMGMFDGRIRLVDAQGTVVADSTGRTDEPLAEDPNGTRLLIIHNGSQVGTLYIDGSLMAMPMGTDSALLTELTRAVLTGALVAGLVALILAAFVVRQITRPVVQLGNAAQQIAQGNLAVRVTADGGDELGELARSFNTMAESLQKQEQLRRNLIADIAHELRTPLSGIQGNIEALQDGVFPLTADNLTPIHDQTLLLNRLVDDLRTLALADAGELNLKLETVDMKQLIIGVLDGFRLQAHEASIVLRVAALSGVVSYCIDGDPARLRQVATNLIANALRHTPPNGSIIVDLKAVGNTLHWRVTDTGEGIPPEDLPSIFDRFYRADGSRSRLTGGTGLGLTIVKQIVAAHQGTISVASPPPDTSHGTRFLITLPVKQ